MQPLTIVGGGITGLAAAYIAAKSGRKVRILEAHKQFGGLLNTFPIGGNRLEFFYHHFFTHDAELLWLLKELDLEDQILWHQTTMGVYKNGIHFPFNSPIDLLKFKPISWLGKFKFALTSVYLGKWASWKDKEGIAALNWFNNYLGKNATDAIWKPLLKIKFGPFHDRVPLAWMIGRLRQRMNSRDKGVEQLGYLNGSLQVLLDTLLNKLKELDVEMYSGEPVVELLIDNQCLTDIKSLNYSFTGGDFLFTIPTHHLSKLMGNSPSGLAKQLDKIEYFGAVCVILEMRKPLSQFYWTNIADEGYHFGGVIEQTNLIPASEYSNSHIIYLSRYFAQTETISQMSNSEISEMMIEQLTSIYPGFKKADLLNVHVFKTNSAATVCDLNFSDKIPNCKSSISNLFLANMAHVYPDERSANNSIRVAAQACRVMGIDSRFIPQNASLAGQIGFSKK